MRPLSPLSMLPCGAKLEVGQGSESSESKPSKVFVTRRCRHPDTTGSPLACRLSTPSKHALISRQELKIFEGLPYI